MTTSIKTCFKCQEAKPLADFYRHPAMADGHLGKCKKCTRNDAMSNRLANLARIRAYDRARGNRQSAEDVRRYRETNPIKWQAHRAVAKAIKRGELLTKPCETCGSERAHAHHDDYSKPLSVRWLCPGCHTAWHREHGEGANAA